MRLGLGLGLNRPALGGSGGNENKLTDPNTGLAITDPNTSEEINT